MQIVVDISKLRCNIRRIKTKLGNRFCAVVKADAYGHGIAVAPYIEPVVDSFFAATYDEAQTLANMGVRKPIFTLGGEISPYLRGCAQNVIPTVSDERQLAALIKSGKTAFSVAVNTGMNRLGAGERELAAIKRLCERCDLAPVSVYSHIYNGISSAREQAGEFDRLTSAPLFSRLRHLYSSCALDIEGELYDMTRCGIAMYGYADGLTGCLAARAKIVAVRRVRSTDSIGYGEHTLGRDGLVATVRCGYADGLRRVSGLTMCVRGELCPVIGMPCMDVCMIDVTDTPCRVGEYAYLIYDKADAQRLAAAYNTIIYEVLTGFNDRAERIYVR